MRETMRPYAAATVLAVLFAAIGTPLSAFNDPDEAGASMSLEDVAYYDGSAWRSAEMTTGALEGPSGGTSPTARVKSEMGGPKTYFILGGAESKFKIDVARPRFRFSGDPSTAAHVQLALFEVKDETRRTPVEIGKGGTMFNRGAELEVTKVRDGLYEARPKKSLQPGEYALVTSEGEPVAEFTIADRGY
jgi:hypothetical protein